MFKKFLLSIMLTLSFVASCMFFCGGFVVHAETQPKQSITYVAFGDSISKGYYINFKKSINGEQNTGHLNVIEGETNSYAPIEGSYVDKIRDELEKTYTVDAYNYSITGDDCQDLLNFIKGGEGRTGFCNLEKAEDSNEIFTTLKNGDVLNSLKNAKVISVCIGANNILSQSISLMQGFLSTGETTRASMENVLKKQIIGDKSDDIKGFKAEFEELLTTLTNINSTAKIYFSNVYNPYKALTAQAWTLLAIQTQYPNFTQDNLNVVSEVAELAIAGGKDSSGNDFVGINNVIENAITESKNGKLCYVNTKSLFDEKYDETNKEQYLENVNVCLNELSVRLDLSEDDVYACFDPHPTYAGHGLIFNAHNNLGLSDVEKFVVTFNTNCDIANQTAEVQDGETVDNPNISRTKYELVGWFKDQACTAGNEWNFETDTVTEDLTLYAKWEQTHFSVTLNFNGGTLNGEQSSVVLVEKNEKITLSTSAQPEKEGNALVGWFKDQACTAGNEWNFETDTVTEDLTLYAKWEQNVFSVKFDFTGGNLNGQNSKTFKVNKGQSLNQNNLNDVINVKQEGYVFEYWYIENQDEEVDLLTIVVTEDITVYAKWKEIVKITINNLPNGGVYTLDKGALVKELYNLVEPKKDGYPFLGWFTSNAQTATELNDNDVLNTNLTIYAKWVELKCSTENLLTQSLSPITKDIMWEINAKVGSVLCWKVDGEVVETVTVTNDPNTQKWAFKPQNVGNFAISCDVKRDFYGQEVVESAAGRSVSIEYSVPMQISFSLVAVNEKTYTFEVDNAQYYDSSKFFWFKTEDSISSDFSEMIGNGTSLKYTFSNDCKICVKYMENEEAPAVVTSNSESVELEFGVDTTTIIVVAVSVAVAALVVVIVVLYKKRYNKFY